MIFWSKRFGSKRLAPKLNVVNVKDISQDMAWGTLFLRYFVRNGELFDPFYWRGGWGGHKLQSHDWIARLEVS